MTTHSIDKQAAKQKLEEKIATCAAGATAAIEQVRDQVPTDVIGPIAKVRFGTQPGPDGNLRLMMGAKSLWPMHANAIAQTADKLGGGKLVGYVRDALERREVEKDKPAVVEAWRANLASQVLEEHARHSEDRVLVRSVKGEIRGVLSDNYRRLDCRPMLDAFVEAADQNGCIPVDGTASETFVSIRALSPELVQVGGDWVAFGVEWRNSDFGHGALSLRSFVLRLWCLNGATTENNLRQIHLGKRLSDDVQYAQETIRTDTRAMALALRDSCSHLFSDKRRAQLAGRIDAAIGAEVDWKQLSKTLSRTLGKEELRQVKESFEGHDTYNLPPGQNLWRASNALSWVAKSLKTASRREELEQLAGSYLADPQAA